MRVAAATALALLWAGCAAPVVHERSVPLDPQEFAELNLLLGEGEAIAWEWSVTGGLHAAFDVHRHGDDGHPERLVDLPDAPSGAGTFTAPDAGSYSLAWTNTGSQPVLLRYRVTGEARIDPDHPPQP